jgi:hypothetical protein
MFYLGHTESFSTNESTLPDLWETWTSSFGLFQLDQLCLSREDSTFPVICHSGANNHIINALDNLTLQESFNGDEDVAIGNHTGLSIFHIGSSVLYKSKTPFKLPFKLKTILNCPSTAINLVSIHTFCVDNKCWFILTNSYFVVKDNLTGQILLQGQVEMVCTQSPSLDQLLKSESLQPSLESQPHPRYDIVD